MDRAYVNEDEGKAVCCWSSDSKASIENLFQKAHAKYEKIEMVEEKGPSYF